MTRTRQRFLVAAILIAGAPILLFSQPAEDRVKLRKLGRVEVAQTAQPASEGESIIEYPSENGQFVGVATHKKGEWDVNEFALRGTGGRILWTRQRLPYGTFFVSNQGHVVQRVGEWGGKLTFFDEKGDVSNSYESRDLVMSQGHIWDENGKQFLVVANKKPASRAILFNPDGSTAFEKELPGVVAWSAHIAAGKAYIVGANENGKELLVLNGEGSIAARLPWQRENLTSVVPMKKGALLVAAFSCVRVDSDLKEVASYTPTGAKLLLTHGKASPNGTMAIVKFKHPSGENDAGILVIDDNAKEIGRKELSAKRLRVRFVGERTAEIETETDRYAVEIR